MRSLVGSVVAGLAGAVLVLVGSVVAAPPAAAHTVAGVPATNYRSQLLEVVPDRPGISVRLLDLGRRISLTNRTAVDLIVLGYAGEPYLRVGPAGVEENLHSPAVYQNRVTPPGVTTPALPATADPHLPPQWRRISSGHTAIWRDRRTRYEGVQPAAVRATPGRPHLVVARWVIEDRLGVEGGYLAGSITWVPGPAATPWVLAAVVLAVLTVLTALSPWWAPGLALWLAGLIALDVVRMIGAGRLAGGSLPLQGVRFVVASFYALIGWTVGMWGIDRLQRRSEAGPVLAGVAGFLLAVLSGATDLPSLVRSQVPNAFPASFVRAGITADLGVGGGLLVAMWVVLRRLPRRRPALPPAEPQ